MSNSFDKYDNIQYCAKEMQTKFGVSRSLLSRKFDKILPRIFVKALANFRWVKQNVAVILAKFRIHWSEISFCRNFAMTKIRTREILSGRKFALVIFPQSEISLEMEAGCNENPRSDCCVCCACACNCLERSLERSSIFFQFPTLVEQIKIKVKYWKVKCVGNR